MAKAKRDVYAEITGRILKQLEDGTVPWKRPWTSTDFPINLKSDAPYRGINIFLLGMAASEKGYTSPCWCTFSQAQAVSGYEYSTESKRNVYRYSVGHMACPNLGKDENGKTIRGEPFEIVGRTKDESGKVIALLSGSTDLTHSDCTVYREGEFTHPKYGVNKGEKGTTIVFWKPIETVARDDANRPVFENGEPVMRSSFLLRVYFVFNVQQCHLPDHVRADTEVDISLGFDANQMCDDCVKSYLGDLGGPELTHGGSRACYSPKRDQVSMPVQSDFDNEYGYYGTLFHELGHSTGHESRLDRIKDYATFGSDPYAREELVAEMTSSMLLGTCGMSTDETIHHSAAYLHSWMKAIKDDSSLIITAAGQAQRASDHIQGISFEDGD